MNKKLLHESASSCHYDEEARHYDSFNEESSKIANSYLEALFKEHDVKSILDLACGTGSQVFWLQKSGLDEVVGVDISPKMLEIAKQKAEKLNLDAELIKGDMRTTRLER